MSAVQFYRVIAQKYGQPVADVLRQDVEKAAKRDQTSPDDVGYLRRYAESRGFNLDAQAPPPPAAPPTPAAPDASSEQKPAGIAKGRPPRFWMPDAVFDQRLTPHELAVYAFLCRTAGKSRRCWPSITTLARRCRMKRDTVIAAIDTLEADGMVECRKRFQKTPIYTLTLPGNWRPVVPNEGLLVVPETGLLDGAPVVPDSAPVVPHLVPVVPQTGQRRNVQKDRP